MLENKVKKSCNIDKGNTNVAINQKLISRLKIKDSIREIYETEGRTARNLVNWRVPIEAPCNEKDKKVVQNAHDVPVRKQRSLSSPRSISSVSKATSASSIRRDIRARYWAYLFENLHRAVDEIYETCESDESIIECKEVIMMLDRYTKDFKSLIERLLVLGAYEIVDKASRPTSLVWELRTSSPGKSLRDPSLIEKQLSNSNSAKHLNFSPNQQSSKTWADRVKRPENNISSKQVQTNKENASSNVHKGKTSLGNSKENIKPIMHTKSLQIKINTADEVGEGWEVVQRGSKPRSRGSTPIIISTARKENNLLTSNIELKDQEISINTNKDATQDQPTSNNNVGETKKELQHEDEALKTNDHHRHDDKQPGLMVEMNKIELNVDAETEIEECIESLDEKQEDAEEEIDIALMSAINEEDSLEHELQREQEAALESVMEEEADVLRELARQESLEIVTEVETDLDVEANYLNSSVNLNESQNKPLDWETLLKQYDENMMLGKGSSWGDMMEETDCRTPGRVVHVHEKLSSPSRKRSAVESLKQHEEKQAKASELRDKHLQDRAEKIRVLSKKIEEIQSWKNKLLSHMRTTMEKKLQRAEKKRQILLQMRVRKAHDEDTKLGEIAFINSLEAQNKRHEIMSKHQESEARLQDMQEERQRRYVENMAKGAAAEERRKLKEAERQLRLHEMQEKRKQRESDFELQKQEKEKERAEAAKAKDREREERMASLREQQQGQIEDLQRKIQQKQEETDRRHREKLEAIQEKASKMSIQHHPTPEESHDQPPNLIPYEKSKFCTICNVLIPSEVYLLSHLHGKQHTAAVGESCTDKEINRIDQDNNMKYISEAPLEEINKSSIIELERLKNLKKKSKKIRQRMAKRGVEFETHLKQPIVDQENKIKLSKIVKDIQKCMQSQSSGPWSQTSISLLERSIIEINRITEKHRLSDVQLLRNLGGISLLCQILESFGQQTKDQPLIIPIKCLSNVIMCLNHMCLHNDDLCDYLLQSNKICSIIDVAYHHLNTAIPEDLDSNFILSGINKNSFLLDPITNHSLNLLSVILFSVKSQKYVTDKNDNHSNALAQINDVISYLIYIGLPDLLSRFFNAIRDSIDEKLEIADILESCLGALIGLVKIASLSNCISFDERKQIRCQQLSDTLQDTQLISIVSMLYGILLHSNAPSRGDRAPPPLPASTISVIRTAVRFLSSIACYDLRLYQKCLGDEGTSLELRHICSYLLWYCQHFPNLPLLHELILAIGYFTLLNPDNQLIIQSGQPPTILQQLCSLPFSFFSDTRQMTILFPTLIACCFRQPRNSEILKQELSCSMLANFIEARSLELTSNSEQNNLKNDSNQSDMNRFQLSARFPPSLWPEGQKYFELS